jgi:hypothetical protein
MTFVVKYVALGAPMPRTPKRVIPPPGQAEAVRLVIDFLKRKKILSPENIKSKTEISHNDYSSFMRGFNTKYKEISDCVLQTVKSRIHSMPEYMLPIVEAAFPQLSDALSEEIYSPNKIFLTYAAKDVVAKRDIIDSYVGKFDVYRYSSHLDKKPMELPVDTHPENKTTVPDPWLIHAVMEIEKHRENEDYARFKIYYRPYEQVEGPYGQVEEGNTFEINGIILPIKDILYFIGLEQTRYPMMIMCVPENVPVIKIFTGMVIRYHERRRIIASRVGFKRVADNTKTLEQLKDTVGLVRESRLGRTLDVFGTKLINEVEYGGRCALLARE